MKDLRDRMNKSIDRLKSQFSGLRTGRANPEILNTIVVDYYGSRTPLKQLAAISVPEPMVLLLNIFDRSAIKDVEKAIQASNLGITPNVDGTNIRLRMPDLTEERRRDLAKVVKTESEEARVSIRNIRRDGLEDLKAKEKSKEISSDDLKKMSDDIQKITNEFIALVDQLAKDKEAEIMKV